MERIAGLPKRRDPRQWLPWILSAVFHLEAAYFGAGLVREQAEARASAPMMAVTEIEVELEPASPGLDGGDQLPSMRPSALSDPPSSGAEVTPRPDDGQHGRAGERASESAVNLAPTDDGVHLTRTWASRIDRAQELRRRRTEGERRSPEDDVVTPSPMMLTFLVEGTGRRLLSPEHRRRARASVLPEPRAARLALTSPSDVGLRARSMPPPGHLGRRGRAGSTGHRGRRERSPRWASPAALRGRIAARTLEIGQARDEVNSEQEVALREPSLLAASAAGGEKGSGRGGQAGEGEETGSGGEQGAGASSRAQGDGEHGASGRDAADRRRTLYIRRVQWRIFNAWGPDDFPASARAAGRGGSSIVSFTIHRSGRISGLRTVRPSGFPSFDAAILRAVRSVSPFPPLPEALGVDHLTMPYEAVATNPAVQ